MAAGLGLGMWSVLVGRSLMHVGNAGYVPKPWGQLTLSDNNIE
jgi:hypothetical protein